MGENFTYKQGKNNRSCKWKENWELRNLWIRYTKIDYEVNRKRESWLVRDYTRSTVSFLISSRVMDLLAAMSGGYDEEEDEDCGGGGGNWEESVERKRKRVHEEENWGEKVRNV